MATTGILYNSDGTATIQTYAGGFEEYNISIYSAEDAPITILSARITLDVLNDIQTGFVDLRCGELPEFAFSNYYVVLLDRRGAIKPDVITTETIATCPIGTELFVDNLMYIDEEQYDNAYITVNITTTTPKQITQDSGDMLFGLAIIIFFISVIFWGFIRGTITPKSYGTS